MSTSVENLIERVLGELHRIVQTETVIGEPIKAGLVTLIPVSKISLGFGAGGGQDGKGQSGTGGGAQVEPIAFIVVDADGKVQILTLQDKEVGLGQLAQLVPEAIDKIKKFVGKKKEHEIPEEEDAEGESEE
jgi:uncharacterized spore protein YtfJ